MKNSISARFARAYFIFWHFKQVLVLSTTWNDLFGKCVDDVSMWWQMFNFFLLCPKRWFQFNSLIVRTHFWSIMILNNWKMMAETRSYVFRWRSRFHPIIEVNAATKEPKVKSLKRSYGNPEGSDWISYKWKRNRNGKLPVKGSV